MAISFIQQAQSQLAPVYGQQISALQSQIQPIQSLYNSLNQGLQGQQQAGNQNILEDASARGVLHSTIPLQGQTALGQQIIQQQGTNAANEAKDIYGVQSQIGGIQTQQAQAIAQLANALQQAFTSQRGLTLQQQQNNREYALQQTLQNQQYKLNLAAAQKF